MQPSTGGTRLRPGFHDPVLQSQQAFRFLLEAISFPGRVVRMGDGLEPPPPLGPALAASCLSLLDYETPLWLEPGVQSEAGRWLAFHCGSPIVADPKRARFGVSASAGLPRLAAFSPGDPEFPDRSATLLVEVDDLEAGTCVRLTGPGIKEAASLSIGGLPDWFWDDWRANGALFPCGVDIFLTTGNRLVALPRTVRVEV